MIDTSTGCDKGKGRGGGGRTIRLRVYELLQMMTFSCRVLVVSTELAFKPLRPQLNHN